MRLMAPKISIVVPMLNEGPNVVSLARQIISALESEQRDFEVVFVDDASTDDTWERILEVQRGDPRVRAIRHARRGGQSAALWTGFRASRGDVIASLDGDLQNDPADLPRLLAELAGCDLACGVRTQRMDSPVRRLSSKIARVARRVVFGVDFRDSACNLRAFKRGVLDTLPAFDGIHRFMPILAQSGGAIVKEVPVQHRPRTAGQSKYGVWNRLGRGILDLVMVALYRRRQLRSISVTEPLLKTSKLMTSDAIHYSEARNLTLENVVALYRANKWSAAEKPELLHQALLGSHSLVTAWDGTRLVGLGNALSDGFLVVYYSHLLVLPEYQSRGIGTRLMRMLMSRYAGFHQHVLVADGRAIEFYRKCGFERAGKTEPMWIYAGHDH
jgi:glycosyltransferase involved in cell wall biosynthesis